MIHALGLRNPWTIAVQPATGRMLVNDIGASAHEEINELAAGDPLRMPPACAHPGLPPVLSPLEKWIRSLR